MSQPLHSRPSPSTADSELFKDRDTKVQRGHHKLQLYPLTLLLTILWLGFIAGTLYALEMAVRRASRAELPWRLTEGPTLLLIGFAQAHALITATYLSRLGVSALQSPHTAPKTWAELFWLTDGGWQGPLGLAATFLAMARLRVRRLSITFILFSLICMLAIPTPIILSKAYPIRDIEISINNNIRANALVFGDLTDAGAQNQTTIGTGTWSTGLPLTETYYESTYLPAYDRQNRSNDVVFSGQLDQEDAVMAAVRMRGSCSIAWTSTSTAEPGFNATEWCQKKSADAPRSVVQHFNATPAPRFAIESCYLQPAGYDRNSWILNPDVGATMDFTLFYFIGPTNNTDIGRIECTSTVDLGTAELSGSTNRFSDFDIHPVITNSSALLERFGENAHPLVVMWDALENMASDSTQKQAIFNILGGKMEVKMGDSFASVDYTAPTPEHLATRLWDGVQHMTASFATLARRADQEVPVVEHLIVSRRQRDKPYLISAFALLGSWLGLLILCSIKLLRPSIASTLSSYAAARLLFEKPSLVVGHRYGDLDGNRALASAFEYSVVKQADNDPELVAYRNGVHAGSEMRYQDMPAPMLHYRPNQNDGFGR